MSEIPVRREKGPSAGVVVVVRPVVLGGIAAAGGGFVVASPGPAGVGLVGYAAAASIVTLGWLRSRPGPRFGLANTVTLTRVVATGWMLALVVQSAWSGPTPMIAMTVAALAALSLALDGVDGRLARRRHECTRFGARFDLEADAVTVLLVTVALAEFAVAGWWIVLIGALRYLYLAAALVVPALREPLPPSRVRRVVGMSQAIVLVVTLALAAVPGPWTPWLGMLPATALVLLTCSFGADARSQLARARSGGSGAA